MVEKRKFLISNPNNFTNAGFHDFRIIKKLVFDVQVQRFLLDVVVPLVRRVELLKDVLDVPAFLWQEKN